MVVDDVLYPILSGFGAGIASVVGTRALLRASASRRKPASGATVEHLQITDEESRRALYEGCLKHIDAVQSEMYKTGRGISRFSGKNSGMVKDVVEAERRAAGRGVTIFRLQTGRHVSGSWAALYSKLAADYPGLVRVFEDFEDDISTSVAVFDPEGEKPVVELLFEELDSNPDGDRFRTVAAIFITGDRKLAQSMKKQHVDRLKKVEQKRMTPERIRALGYDRLYFAYGSDMEKKEFRTQAPNARFVGLATLKDWERDFWVSVEGLEGVAAGIYPSPDTEVLGVLYAISDEERAALEGSGTAPYDLQDVRVYCNQDAHDAITLVPRQPFQSSGSPDAAYLTTMRNAARKQGLFPLFQQLKDASDAPWPRPEASEGPEG
ncbi:MAG: gamma-glutamylcyclotransferase [Actinomycetota bacterium]|nr:gamma-glutamylcyclotransferase [Actinomycetota bacterium]